MNISVFHHLKELSAGGDNFVYHTQIAVKIKADKRIFGMSPHISAVFSHSCGGFRGTVIGRDRQDKAGAVTGQTRPVLSVHPFSCRFIIIVDINRVQRFLGAHSLYVFGDGGSVGREQEQGVGYGADRLQVFGMQKLIREQTEEGAVRVVPKHRQQFVQTGDGLLAANDIAVNPQRPPLLHTALDFGDGDAGVSGRIDPQGNAPRNMKGLDADKTLNGFSSDCESVVADIDAEIFQVLAVRVPQQIFDNRVVGAVVIPEKILNHGVNFIQKWSPVKHPSHVRQLPDAALGIFLYLADAAVYGGIYDCSCDRIWFCHMQNVRRKQ